MPDGKEELLGAVEVRVVEVEVFHCPHCGSGIRPTTQESGADTYERVAVGTCCPVCDEWIGFLAENPIGWTPKRRKTDR